MTLKLTWLNCFWLILPLLAWDLLLGARITDTRVTSDAQSPKWLLIAENISRMLVFAIPLLFPLQLTAAWSKAGFGIYIIGTLVYFTAWLPLIFAPNSAWSNCPAGLLAPRLAPFLSFLGITLIGHAWPYGLVAAAFILIHTWHGIQNL